MENVENEAESAKIRVKDRRRFSPEGEPLDESLEAPEPELSASNSTESAQAATATSEPDGASAIPADDDTPAFDPSSYSSSQPPMPTASMELLVMSLAMQAELELGAHGKSEEQPPNLDLARHSIDMLAVLQEKTKGNLSFEEKRQLDNAVTMLRFRYVQAVQELNQKARA